MNEIYKKILQSEEEYWVLAKETTYREYLESKRGTDEILFIAIPAGIRRGLRYDDVLLSDMEKLKYSEIPQNIHLSGNYSPFQIGQTFYSIYDGFPVRGIVVREFLKMSLDIKSNDLVDYENLYKKLIENNGKE